MDLPLTLPIHPVQGTLSPHIPGMVPSQRGLRRAGLPYVHF